MPPLSPTFRYLPTCAVSTPTVFLPYPATARRCWPAALTRRRNPRLLPMAPSFALLDAQNAQGQISGVRAMVAVRRGRPPKTGVATVGVRNSNHYGMGAYYAMMALDQDLIGTMHHQRGQLDRSVGRYSSQFRKQSAVCRSAGR